MTKNNHPLGLRAHIPETTKSPPTPQSINLRVYVLLAALTIPFAGCVAVLAIYVVPTIKGLVSELKEARSTQSERAVKDLDTASKLEAARKEVTRQQAAVIANQELTKQLTAENLRLATELNKTLTQLKREQDGL